MTYVLEAIVSYTNTLSNKEPGDAISFDIYFSAIHLFIDTDVILSKEKSGNYVHAVIPILV